MRKSWPRSWRVADGSQATVQAGGGIIPHSGLTRVASSQHGHYRTARCVPPPLSARLRLSPRLSSSTSVHPPPLSMHMRHLHLLHLMFSLHLHLPPQLTISSSSPPSLLATSYLSLAAYILSHFLFGWLQSGQAPDHASRRERHSQPPECRRICRFASTIPNARLKRWSSSTTGCHAPLCSQRCVRRLFPACRHLTAPICRPHCATCIRGYTACFSGWE